MRSSTIYSAVCVMCASMCVAVVARPQSPANSIQSSTATAKDEIPEYPTKYDSIDVDLILGNDRIIRRYIDCILDRGPCTREGLDLKSKLKCVFNLVIDI